jgi:1-aminocyclopropane-1-carboxylate deaminase
MNLHFLPRHDFDEICRNPHLPPTQSYSIPMGGYGPMGAKGAAHILDFIPKDYYSHIFCAAGTGTMSAGLALSKGKLNWHV